MSLDRLEPGRGRLAAAEAAGAKPSAIMRGIEQAARAGPQTPGRQSLSPATRPGMRLSVGAGSQPSAAPSMRSKGGAGAMLRPQAMLHQAAQHAQHVARPHAVPSGLGLDSVSARARMVARLRRLGILDEAVLDALSHAPRHAFVDAALAAQAYEDTSLPIGLGQTISKPSVVARMIELLMVGARAHGRQRLGRVLEIGTGCGYQAAVLSRLAASVLSIERLKPLHEKARELLAPIRAASTGGGHIRLLHGDGMLGHAPNAPYDSIISAAGGERLPQHWLDQLAIGGRLVAPLHDIRHGGQVLVVIDRTEAGFERSVHEQVHFVPLKSGVD